MLENIKSRILWYRFGRIYFKKKIKKNSNLKFYSFSKYLNYFEFRERNKYKKKITNLISSKKGYAIIPKIKITNDEYDKSLLEIKNKFNKTIWNKQNYQKSFLMIEDVSFDDSIKNIVNILLPYLTNYIIVNILNNN